MSKRIGPTHHYTSFAYLLQTACKMWDRGDEHKAHFSTVWDHVTCRVCREHKPLTKQEETSLVKLAEHEGEARVTLATTPPKD